VVSVFGGAADRGAYLQATGASVPTARPPKTNLTEQNRSLNALYATVRRLREGVVQQAELSQTLQTVLAELDARHRDDWLLRTEMLELALRHGLQSGWLTGLRQRLVDLGSDRPDHAALIARGLALLDVDES
jgi:hypothetical protein